MTNEELVSEYQNGNDKAFDQLLENNKGLLYKLKYKWYRFVSSGIVSDQELEQECVFGLWLAAKEYSSEKDASFSTYAFSRIPWHLQRVLQKNPPVDASGNEVNIVSIDSVVPGTDDFTLADTIPDEEAEAVFDVMFEKLDTPSLQRDIKRLLNSLLPQRQSDIILKHFGIGCDPMPFSEIAQIYNCSVARIGQLESKAMKTLKKSPLTQRFGEKYSRKVEEAKKKEHKQKKHDIIEHSVTNGSIADALSFFGI